MDAERPLEAEPVFVQPRELPLSLPPGAEGGVFVAKHPESRAVVTGPEKVPEPRRAVHAHQEAKDPLLARLEHILSRDLEDLYAALPQDKQQQFRMEGEELAQWLQGAIARGEVNSHQVLTRIERWLLVIEGRGHYSPWVVQHAFLTARGVLKEIMYHQIGH